MKSKLNIKYNDRTMEYEISINIPAMKERFNPEEDGVGGFIEGYDTITGVISDSGDSGLAFTIDMGYKGKPDQRTDIFINSDMLGWEPEDMINWCEKNGVHYEIDYKEQVFE